MHQKKKIIIGLCGYSQSGKDTLCRLMKGTRFAFADHLKKEVSSMLGAVEEEYDEADKEFWRELLVLWGRLRRKQNPDYWLRHIIYQIARCREAEAWITDVRYLNEARYILEGKRNKGYLFYIHRHGTGPANIEEEKTIKEILAAYDLPAIQNIADNPEHMIKQYRQFRLTR